MSAHIFEMEEIARGNFPAGLRFDDHEFAGMSAMISARGRFRRKCDVSHGAVDNEFGQTMAAIIAGRGTLRAIKASRVLAKVSPPRSILERMAQAVAASRRTSFRWVRCIRKGCRLMEPAAHRPSLVQAGGNNTVNPNRHSPNGVWKRRPELESTSSGHRMHARRAGKIRIRWGNRDMRGSRFVLRVVGLGAAAAFALQPAHAGERKPAAVQAHHLGASIHKVALVAPARSGLRANPPKTMRKDVTSLRDDFGESRLRSENGREPAGVRSGASRNTTHGEFSFVPVTPLGTEAGGQSRLRQVDGVAREKGPTTPPAERKSIAFFRLNPKLGDVSVQPVVGGVNGAQLSVGF